MKKILLIIAITFCIFQLVVLADVILIGWPAIDRGSSLGAYTFINDNPANESGVINSVEIWCATSLVDCEVAIFTQGDANVFSTGDSEVIGAVEKDAKRTFVVNLDVQAGNYIGMYYTSGNIERDSSGCDGMWVKSGDNIPCIDITFSNYATSAISLYGTGVTIVVGWPHEWNTKAISKWNTKEIIKWNELE